MIIALSICFGTYKVCTWSSCCNFFQEMSKKVLADPVIESSAFQKKLQWLDQTNTCDIFDLFWQKTTGSSANFLSPETNGQALRPTSSDFDSESRL